MEPDKANKIILPLLSLAISAVTLWQWYQAYTMFKMYGIFPGGASIFIWDVSVALLFSLAVLLFIFGKKAGWVLLAILLTYKVIVSLALFAVSLYLEQPGSLWVSGRPVPLNTPAMHLLIVVFYCVLQLFLYRKHTRALYRISGKLVSLTFVIALLLCVLVYFNPILHA